MILYKYSVAAITVSFAFAALSYLPPRAERCGVRVEIGSFPQKIEQSGKRLLGVTEVQAGAPRPFPVTVENKTDKPISGNLEVWMNDDWDVAGPQGVITLAPKGKKELSYTGTARPRVLNALYPVHARFTPVGVDKKDAPHPIAIFMFKNPNAPRPAQEKECSDPNMGNQPNEPTESDWQTRCAAALAKADAALRLGEAAAAERWRLMAGDCVYGAGVAYGKRGIIDGALAFTDGERSIIFRGFCVRVETNDNSPPPEAKAAIRENKGTLQVSWSLPGVKQNDAGFPRITDIAVGPASEALHRVYMGFGNVIEHPKDFTLNASGFGLSTRHVSADYANGLSVVQAVDVVPDSVTSDGKRNIFSLHAHHDATFTFVPSSKGSFEAARRFRAVSGYRPSPGLAALGSRMCLDQWSGDYIKAAEDIALAAKYGMNDSIFIKHAWQRYGFDYRLPDIYPPAGNPAAFGAMRQACRKAGILFCPHDNYTDIYPDCGDFSYDLTVFNLDGTPQLAWFNFPRHARSYRWAPHAFHPWCLRNAKLLKGGYDPDAVFIDVFTAHCPFDYLDREGRFHTKNETSRNWGRGFEVYRQAFCRPDTVCISEAGQDHLVGVADAGQCDHFGAARLVGGIKKFADSERTPWHDIVTHGYYVLFSGGLGMRYMEEKGWDTGGDPGLHGYASDDYLSICMIGGRNPMCNGPFSRNAVKTYWLQHDACAELGRSEFLDLRYEGNIHRQHSFFSNGGEVWVNRQTNATWRLPSGIVLPTYGYYAKTRGTESGIVEQDGVRCAFAKSPGALFIDARKPFGEHDQTAISHPLRTEVLAPNSLRLFIVWKTVRPMRGYRSFAHVCTSKGMTGKTLFTSAIARENEILDKIGTYETSMDLTFPDDAPEGAYYVRYGAWHPGSKRRVKIGGAPNDGKNRVTGGKLIVERKGGKISKVRWRPEGPYYDQAERDIVLGVNRAGRAVEFGGIKTDGSFRFADWTVTPLPDSDAFSAEIDLAAFGAAGLTVDRVDAVEPGEGGTLPSWNQAGNLLRLSCDAKSFAYRIHFHPDGKANTHSGSPGRQPTCAANRNMLQCAR